MISKIKRNSWLQDIRMGEYAAGAVRWILILGAVLYLFYESLVPAVFLIPLSWIYVREWLEDTAKKKEEEFRNQFRDSIQAMASALKAGYSVENAIREVNRELAPMYGEDTRIRREYKIMAGQLEMNAPAEQVLREFAERAGQEDVESFVHVFAAAKKSGGDSIAIIRNSVKIISEKIDTEKEIQTMLAAKKLEFDLMCVIPFGIILYMKLTFREFIGILYGNLTGAAVMSCCLLLYLAAYRLGKKITKIEI